MKNKVVIGLSVLIFAVFVGLGIFAAFELSDKQEPSLSEEYCYVLNKHIKEEEGTDGFAYCLDISVEGTDIEKTVTVSNGIYNNVEIGSMMKCVVTSNSDGSVDVELVK